MRKPIASVLLAVVVFFVVVSVGTAAPGAASPPRRDGGHGRWYERACSAAPSGRASCGAQVVSDANGNPSASSTPPAGAYGPVQLHGGYSLPTTAPNAQTIAIVDAYNDPNAESDLATFDNYYGLPACTTANGCFRKVNQSGGTSYPPTNSGWALEIALDVETAHEICQNCKILLVEASSNSFTNLGTAENEAVALGATVISNSWGGSEFSSETQTESSYFNHQGIAITVAAGDNGYGVEFPAASRYVTAVGGTTLALNSDNTYKSESVWSGTGSGCSQYEPKPSWQVDTGCSHRTVADVSADADPNTGVAVYDSVPTSGQSGWFQVGGTSLATPLIAAAYALTGNPGAASYGSAPYAHPSLLHDITSGNNGSCSPTYLCTASPGYDGPTGLGSLNGIGAFSSALIPDFSLAVSPSSQTVAPGASTTYLVTMTASGGFNGVVSLGVSGLPSGAGASCNPASLSPSSGSCTLTATTTAGTPTGSSTLTITGTSGSLSHTTTTTLTVSRAAPPANTALPVISGTTQQGQSLSTSNGSWSGSPTSYGYQWSRCDSSGASCAPINGATGSSYTLAAADVNFTIRATVTATNAGGSASASSNQTATITAPAAPPYNTLTARHSSKCLDVYGISQANGAAVDQWACNGGPNQLWQLVSVGAGYYNIVVKHSGQCLDVYGVSQADGAAVDQWPCNGGANQQWQLVATNSGYSELVARHSGKCLDVYGISQANGAAVDQWTCNGGLNQQWLISPAG